MHGGCKTLELLRWSDRRSVWPRCYSQESILTVNFHLQLTGCDQCLRWLGISPRASKSLKVPFSLPRLRDAGGTGIWMLSWKEWGETGQQQQVCSEGSSCPVVNQWIFFPVINYKIEVKFVPCFFFFFSFATSLLCFNEYLNWRTHKHKSFHL